MTIAKGKGLTRHQPKSASRPRVLFFSRGRGHGHIIPDIRWVKAIREINRNVRIEFVSYGTGAEILGRFNEKYFDLKMPEDNDYLHTLFGALRLLGDEKVDLVISHEEFAALPAASFYGLPSLFISEWLPRSDTLFGESLHYSSAIAVLQRPGLFMLEPGLRERTTFLGNYVREPSRPLRDRLAVRRSLGIPEGNRLILVTPGAWATEERAPISHLVIPAFRALRSRYKSLSLLWISKPDYKNIEKLLFGIENAAVIEFCDPVQEVVAASDIVITKGARNSTMEAASLGIPSIALSHELNPIDDFLIPQIPSNTYIKAKAIGAHDLEKYIEHTMFEQGRSATKAYGGTNSSSIVKYFVDWINKY